METERHCQDCQALLPADAPEGLCPKCLMKVGLGSQPAATSSKEETTVPEQKFSGTPPPPIAEIAMLFPQFEIVELLGQGGMGVVYKARQPRLDRLVALKILSPAAGRAPAFAERFAREAKTLARLNHPGIVAIYDFGQAGDFFYLLMEYVDGANLHRLIRSKQLTPREALSIVTQICEALQYAHDEGIVHRDIKPGNILMDKKGRVKIADFGLAKLVGKTPADATLTRTDQVMGTPAYMAPEQLERPMEVDHRADIYSLGVVFYEMLTGELPIGRFASPSQKVQVDVRLDEVVLKTLEREPERRYQHASEVKTDVETISAGKTPPTKARSTSSTTTSPFWGLPWLGISSVAPWEGPQRLWRFFAGIVLATLVIYSVANVVYEADVSRAIFAWMIPFGAVQTFLLWLISKVSYRSNAADWQLLKNAAHILCGLVLLVPVAFILEMERGNRWYLLGGSTQGPYDATVRCIGLLFLWWNVMFLMGSWHPFVRAREKRRARLAGKNEPERRQHHVSEVKTAVETFARDASPGESGPTAARGPASTPTAPPSVLRSAWDEWWSQRSQVLVKTVKTGLLAVYLISLFMFFTYRSSGSMNGFRVEIGYPTHWFLVEQHQSEQGGGHSIGMNLSATWLILGLGIFAYYIHTRIAKVDGTFKPKEHAFISTWLPLIMAAIAVTAAILPLILELLKTKPQ